MLNYMSKSKQKKEIAIVLKLEYLLINFINKIRQLITINPPIPAREKEVTRQVRFIRAVII